MNGRSGSQQVALPAAPLHVPLEHAAGASSYMHPCESVPQVATEDVLAQVGPGVFLHTGSVLQTHLPDPADPLQVWCVPHVDDDASYKHPSASCAHWATEDLLAVQTPPTAVHVGSALQVQAAEPAEPVHVWFELLQATGAPYDQQPLDPFVHVARPPETHEVFPWAQLFVQVGAQAAEGAAPEQPP
jgi:hypothetical protein